MVKSIKKTFLKTTFIIISNTFYLLFFIITCLKKQNKTHNGELGW